MRIGTDGARGRRAGWAWVAFAGLIVTIGAGADGDRHPALVWAEAQARRVADRAIGLYRRTPADERITWGGLIACAVLGASVLVERSLTVRRGRVVPKAYTGRFHDRLVTGKLDRGKALDFCELNPSPAARVVLSAVKRWGRPVGDLERAVNLARAIEADRLRRHVGTLRRVAVLAPLVGLLGTLLAANRGLAAGGDAWQAVVSRSLAALTVGVGLAILSLLAYDGLAGRVETLIGLLDRLGAEAVDAIASSAAEPATAPAKVPPPKGKFRRDRGREERSEIPLEGTD